MAVTQVRFPYETPTLSITYKTSPFRRASETSIKLNHCPANARKQHFYNLALRVALLIRHSLNVSVHGDLQSSVTEQSLNDFGVLSIGIQDRPKRMTEGVPADT